jgi:hypothetical protein
MSARLVARLSVDLRHENFSRYPCLAADKPAKNIPYPAESLDSHSEHAMSESPVLSGRSFFRTASDELHLTQDSAST